MKALPESLDSIELSWMTPADNGGCQIIHYVVEKREAMRMVCTPIETKCSTLDCNLYAITMSNPSIL